MKKDTARAIISNLDKNFEVSAQDSLYRQFPTWGEYGEMDDLLFGLDPEGFEIAQLDRMYDLWLCISRAGFKKFSRFACKALILSHEKASASSIIGNFLVLLTEEPLEWLSDFSNSELKALRDTMKFLERHSGEPSEYRPLVNTLNGFILN